MKLAADINSCAAAEFYHLKVEAAISKKNGEWIFNIATAAEPCSITHFNFDLNFLDSFFNSFAMCDFIFF